MPTPRVIDTYLDTLRDRLPGEIVDELVDGLHETFDHHRALGLSPEAAARAALAEFGAADLVLASFEPLAPGRTAARLLLATGPLVGGCWAAALILGHAWTWPIPTSAAIAFATVLAATATMLITACRTRYRRVRPAALTGGAGLLLLDVTALITLPGLAPSLSGLLQCAILASGLRICFTASSLRRLAVSP
jgi:hypothetical protein